MKKTLFIVSCAIVIFGFVLPERATIPVVGATNKDYNKNSFWFYPWGASVTHKGVDIFAKKGTDIQSSNLGVVVFSGEIKVGGKVVVALGPKWKLHYYAHLDQLSVTSCGILKQNSKIGTVGDSGNAKGKQPHLHYSIISLFPRFWRIDRTRQGWKKIFFLNPITYFEN